MQQVKGAIYGIIYGFTAWVIFTSDFGSYSPGLMTFSFVFLVPFAMGLLVAFITRQNLSRKRADAILWSFTAIAGFLLIPVLAGLESMVCAALAFPVFTIMALSGGYSGMLIFNHSGRRYLLLLLLSVPFLAGWAEDYKGRPARIFTQKTTLKIKATDEVVWKQLTRVTAISESENRPSVFQFMGLPRPLQAELNDVVVGGVRIALFDQGLFFKETVTAVIPKRRLVFDIEANPAGIPLAALDQHLMVGGLYFDVLEGAYEIEKISRNEVLLHLTSRFRLTTGFNLYSGFWGKRIMHDIQQNILQVIKRRSENSLILKN